MKKLFPILIILILASCGEQEFSNVSVVIHFKTSRMTGEGRSVSIQGASHIKKFSEMDIYFSHDNNISKQVNRRIEELHGVVYKYEQEQNYLCSGVVTNPFAADGKVKSKNKLQFTGFKRKVAVVTVYRTLGGIDLESNWKRKCKKLDPSDRAFED
jgi:hypothetical protein